MAKVAIVNSSQLEGCWSAARYTGLCATCDRVMRCKLPEARPARIKIFEARVREAEEVLAQERQQLDEELEKQKEE